jgi:hypothetical protein
MDVVLALRGRGVKNSRHEHLHLGLRTRWMTGALGDTTHRILFPKSVDVA